MTVQQRIQAIDDSGWEVPAHEAAIYAPRRHAHALVIPVINEGDRIRGQLERIRDAGLAVDVIVADGGSTDGSLDAEFVRPVGVRAVLTKTGPGKLSAQLRMAYAWCLREGYEGIVTIDGNGKDGVEAVAAFVAKLEEGCDYVQGSRYLPGGEAENTPLERTIANRLIHAPLLSIAGRHIFTDTTNGFRAYSARYLTHPEVQPFRHEFSVYNLLFYLTVRAGQLGLKVDHVPVVRRYPESGKVPTKIGGFGSKLALLGETVQAATGGYTPDDAAPRMPSLGWPALAALLVLLPLLWSVMAAPPFSPDSWALYELSQTVFGDFYRFSHFRSYTGELAYSGAFPPLWPTLIALIDGTVGTGARTGVYLAFAAFYGFALVSEMVARRVIGAPWIGLALAFLLLLGPDMVWGEMAGGRTIPLQLLLYALVLLGLLKGRGISLLRAAAIGLVAGLAVLNRFDAALLPVFAALMIAVLTRSPLKTLAALAASLLAVSPWIAYSLSVFGTVFATDNGGVAMLLDPQAFVTDWWPGPQPAIGDDPARWLAKIAANIGRLGYNALALMNTPMGYVLVLAAAGLAALQFVASKRPQTGGAKIAVTSELWILTAFTILVAAMMAPQIVTGYLDYRYYSAPFWTAFLALCAWLIASASTRAQRVVLGRLPALFIGAAVASFCIVQMTHERPVRTFDAPQDVLTLAACLAGDTDARILVLGDDNFAAKAGSLGGLSTMMEPRNMREGRLDADGALAFVKAWDVGYVLAAKPDRLPDAQALARTGTRVDCPQPLFKLAGAAQTR